MIASSKNSTALYTVELVRYLSLIYLEMHLDSSSMRAKLSPARLEAFVSLLSCTVSRTAVIALSGMLPLGKMSASHAVVPLCLLHMKKLQS